MIRAIFWDNDGVLVDTERLYFRATQQVLAGIGVPLTQDQYLEWFMVQGTGAWHLAAERGFPPEAIDRMRRERNERYSDLLGREPLVISGVREVLEALHGSYTMGIVTSSERDHFEIIHRSSGLLPYFQFVLTNSDYTHSKPHPEPYLLAVERSGFRKEECLVVEDTERGLTAAMAAGLACVVVPSEFTRRCAFAGARHVLEGITDLLEVLSPEKNR